MMNDFTFKRKKAIVPICGRNPIIEDEYVDIEFGTGCLKVTAHDMNDKTLGEKHNQKL
jgi:valyl-tRNA synthetase